VARARIVGLPSLVIDGAWRYPPDTGPGV